MVTYSPATPGGGDAIGLSDDDVALVSAARRDGFVTAKLYDRGDFNEEGFLLFGRLETLCRKGVMRFVDLIGKNERTPEDVRMVFALADGGRA